MHLWVLQQDIAKHEVQTNLCHLSEIHCAVGQVWPGSQAIKQAAHTFKELPHNTLPASVTRGGREPSGKSEVRFGPGAGSALYTDKSVLTGHVGAPRPAHVYPPPTYPPYQTPAGSREHACSQGSHPSELSYLLAPQLLVAMALGAQEVLQQAQQPKHLLGEAGQDPSGGLFDVGQG